MSDNYMDGRRTDWEYHLHHSTDVSIRDYGNNIYIGKGMEASTLEKGQQKGYVYIIDLLILSLKLQSDFMFCC